MSLARKPVIGLIGGIGSGKSFVAAEFVRLGGHLIQGDQLGHQALEQPEVVAAVLARWPEVVTAGKVDRRKLGAIVFATPAQLKELEALLFPWIERGIAAGIAVAGVEPNIGFVVLDAAVLLEAGWNKFCDWIVYIHAPRSDRLARLSSRRGWTTEEVDRRSAAQWPLTAKARRAEAAIDNREGAHNLARQVRELLARWRIPVATGASFVDNT